MLFTSVIEKSVQIYVFNTPPFLINFLSAGSKNTKTCIYSSPYVGCSNPRHKLTFPIKQKFNTRRGGNSILFE